MGLCSQRRQVLLVLCASIARSISPYQWVFFVITILIFVIAASAYSPNHSATKKRKSDHLDKLIAFYAIALNAILVTKNERNFVIYPILKAKNGLHADD
jgi:formate hydrogenlyase subunit 3/multisubunit Na+/H+ antiporter MnhD subunit